MRVLLFAGMLLGLCARAEEQKWHFKTSLGLNLNHLFNQNFVGSQNGQQWTPGVQLSEEMRLQVMPHVWRTELDLAESWTLSTPQTAFVKWSDSLSLKSYYFYHLVPWFGPYAAAKLRTSVFTGDDVESIPITYTITYAETGAQTTYTSTGSAENGTYVFHLTNPFFPLILEQDLGVFFQPHQIQELFLEFRIAATARESLGKDQRILTAHGVVYDNTPVRQLDNVYELGPSVGVSLKGELWEKKLHYRLGTDLMWSFLQVPYASFHSTNRFSFETSTNWGVNLTPWLSLHWQFKAIFNPAVLDQVQLMSNLMLSVNYFH